MAGLAARSVNKAFGGTAALQGVDLELTGGEIHALVGENGSGKSTLLRVIAGALRPDEGHLELDGERAEFHRPGEATAAGIVLVTQEGSIVPDLSVAENVFIGRRLRNACRVDWARMHRRTQALLGELDVDIDPRAVAGALAPDQRRLVEVARALSYDARVVLLDEPTSALDLHEVDVLLRVMRALAGKGIAVAFVSHRMSELISVADRFTVLRDGIRVGAWSRADVDEDLLVRAMVGRALRPVTAPPAPSLSAPALRVQDLSDASGKVRSVSIEVAAGEIVGLAGLVGAGRTELLETIAGARIRAQGSVAVDGRKVARGPRAALARGLVLLSDDRQRKGLLPALSVHDNAALVLQSGHRRMWRRRRSEAKTVTPWLERLSVRCGSWAQPVEGLSGGNQQKVLLARALARAPRVILLDEPTAGIDLGSKQQIYAEVRQIAERGSAVLVASSELSELLAMCHRILVMREGLIVADVPRAQFSEETVVAFATGANRRVAV